jgi:hypothetical protein
MQLILDLEHPWLQQIWNDPIYFHDAQMKETSIIFHMIIFINTKKFSMITIKVNFNKTEKWPNNNVIKIPNLTTYQLKGKRWKSNSKK